MKNFQEIFIWSCPPKRDVDYIFHEKPANMKIPTRTRLGEWYKKLLNLAVEEHIAESFEGIKSYAESNNWNNINNIPYFDCDLWPTRLLDAITTAEKRTKKCPENLNVMEKILSLMKIQIDGFDQQYFVLHLQPASLRKSASAYLPDDVITRWINNRNNLVDMFFEHRLEFSNERLAKFSTFILLYRIIIDLRICIQCRKFSSPGLTTSLMCMDCSERHRINSIDTSLWKILKKEDIIIQDSNNFFKVSVPVTPLLEKREQNFIVTKTCIKRKFKEEHDNFDYTVPAKKKKYETQTASSEMFNKQFTPMETRAKKIDYKKVKKFFI
jgi:hypothetical protein